MVEDLLYALSLGHERNALNPDRTMMRAGSWRSFAIATGEIPIVDDDTQQGATNRTFALNAEPFSDAHAAQAMHRLVAAQHGTAGRTYLAALRGNARAFHEGRLAELSARLSERFPVHPQADNAALIALADALVGFCVFGNGAWEPCVEGALSMVAWTLANATGTDGGGTNLKTIQYFGRVDRREPHPLRRVLRGVAAGALGRDRAERDRGDVPVVCVLEHARPRARGGKLRPAQDASTHGRGGAARHGLGTPPHEAEALQGRGAQLLRLRRQRSAEGLPGAVVLRLAVARGRVRCGGG